jgi:hypothetical protein
MIRLYIFMIVSLFSCLCLPAQVRPKIENKIRLLNQLSTEKQKEQIFQLLREEKLQKYWRDKRLEQILTPEQLKKLR